MTGTSPRPVILPAPDPTRRRISLRRQGPDGARDVVGHLLAANADWLVVQPEDRPAVWVPRGEATAIREVPERPVLAGSGAEQVERLLERGLPASARARLGGWVLRRGDGADPGWVLGAGDPGMPFAAALTAAGEWAGGPIRLRVVAGSGTERDAVAAGFASTAEAVVLVAGLPPAPRGPARRDAVFVVVDADDRDALALHASQGLVEHHRHRYLAR